MSQPVNGTSERLLTLLDLAKAAPSGASLGADFDDAQIDRRGPAVAADLIAQEPSVAADINTGSSSIAADLIAQEPSVAADIREPSVAADQAAEGSSIAADGPDI